jgi:hypothetical protein
MPTSAGSRYALDGDAVELVVRARHSAGAIDAAFCSNEHALNRSRTWGYSMKNVLMLCLSDRLSASWSNSRRRRSLVVCGALLAGLPAASAIAAMDPDYVTTIAVDKTGLKAWGMAYGLPVFSGSDRIAIEHCQMRGGKDCQLWISNLNSCLAVAGPENKAEPGLYYGAGGSLFNPNQRQTAIDSALNACRSELGKACAIREVGCAFDEMPDHEHKTKPEPKPKSKPKADAKPK